MKNRYRFGLLFPNLMEDTHVSESKKTVLTLCGVQGCCPTVEIKEEGVLIKDDVGGKVQLNSDQWGDLKKKILQQET